MIRSSRLVFVVLLLTAVSLAVAKPKDKHALPPRATAGVDHIVVVMMENRSFDHLLGWHPTAEARQTGLSYRDENGTSHATAPLAPDLPGLRVPRSRPFLDGWTGRL